MDEILHTRHIIQNTALSSFRGRARQYEIDPSPENKVALFASIDFYDRVSADVAQRETELANPNPNSNAAWYVVLWRDGGTENFVWHQTDPTTAIDTDQRRRELNHKGYATRVYLLEAFNDNGIPTNYNGDPDEKGL